MLTDAVQSQSLDNKGTYILGRQIEVIYGDHDEP